MERLPDQLTCQLYLLVAPRTVRTWINDLLARLALAGPVRILDGGNCFQAYPLARALRQNTSRPTAILERVQVARAFTCYQVQALLAATPALPVPSVVLDFLSTFRDENVTLDERRRLLGSCLEQLVRLSRAAPVAIYATPAAPPDELLERLEAAASQVWCFESPSEPAVLRLF